jgi:hypothetical protein
MDKGLEYAPGMVGKYLFRMRETHVRDHLAPLLSRGANGAVKLDIAMRGLALDPRHQGQRPTAGMILPRHSYSDLHDLVRAPDWYGDELEAPEVNQLKRKWVNEQLAKLEDIQLIRRVTRPGKRPILIVLKDDGSGDTFDDPDGRGENSYLTILGGIISSGELAEWSGPETAFYLAAMVAERFETEYRRSRQSTFQAPAPGGGEWWRPLTWFSDPDRYRRDTHVRIPFSESTLERGLDGHRQRGLVTTRHIRVNPVTKRRIESGRRNLYHNRFDTLAASTVSDSEMEQLIEEINTTRVE